MARGDAGGRIVMRVLVPLGLIASMGLFPAATWAQDAGVRMSEKAVVLPDSSWRDGVIKRDENGRLYLAPPPESANSTDSDENSKKALPIDAPEKIAKMVHALAPRYQLDPNLVLAIISVESAFRVDAVSHKGARGLMQLIPATANRFGVANPFDAEDNLHGGMKYLRWLVRRFGGKVSDVVAAYNAGEGAVERYGGIPPYSETRDYVAKVKKLYRSENHPL